MNEHFRFAGPAGRRVANGSHAPQKLGANASKALMLVRAQNGFWCAEGMRHCCTPDWGEAFATL
jgi:hypothetical protein